MKTKEKRAKPGPKVTDESRRAKRRNISMSDSDWSKGIELAKELELTMSELLRNLIRRDYSLREP
jgi:hypothetical protein